MTDERYTPQWVIEAARKVMGEIDLDLAASCAGAGCGAGGAVLVEDAGRGADGLVWPGVAESAVFGAAAVCGEVDGGIHVGNVKQAVVLLNNATETGWFQALLALPVCFLSKRLAFWRHDHADVGARQGQAVFTLGPDVERCEVFGEFGIVVRRVD